MLFKDKIKKLIPLFLLDFYHYALAFIGAVIFGFPGRKLIVIGVTGTSGKSTTVDFITRILEEPFDSAQGKAGNKVVSNSSIRFKIGENEKPNDKKMGMPGRFFMQKLLWLGVKEKCKYAVLEVTSEGIKQYRHKFINFDCAVFTNLSPEHIESHGSFEKYRKEKLKLFKATKYLHVINIDDGNAKYFLDIPAKKIVTFGLNKGDFNLKNTDFHLNILGNFNLYNALAAIAVVTLYGIYLEISKKALEKVRGIPGRMEIIQKEPFLVVVDYAHTPVQLEEVYKSLEGKNLICVLGSCGGGRDKWKRPVLGKIASQYCREVIITNEDPYDENPMQIIKEVASGIKHPKPNTQHLILDRKEAIKKAIAMAKPGNTVIITGKGSESWMCLEDSKKIPWDDREITKEELKSRRNY